MMFVSSTEVEVPPAPAHAPAPHIAESPRPQVPPAAPLPKPPPPVQPISTPNLRITEPADTLRFMFGVGIECSYPTIAGNVRVDQLRDTGHYEMWQTDLRLVRELGLRYLRYGPPIYR